MTLRVLISGAGGFVGRVVCAQAARKGLAVRCALRKEGESLEDVELAIVGEINGETDWDYALRDVDVVIHLAARVHVMRDASADPFAEFRRVNVLGTENLARQAVRAGVKRLVYVSSIKVNGEETVGGRSYSEQDIPAPRDAYGISKWEAEQALHRVARETGMTIVIMRPPLVYGAGVKGNFVQMLKVLARGVPLPLGSIQNLRSLVYVENLADALLLCATHPAAANQTYLISDGEDTSTPGLLQQLGSGMGRPARLLRCPEALLKVAGHFAGKSDQIDRLLGSLQVDSGKIRRELNWTPPYSLQQGLQETAEWYRRNHL